MPSKLDLNTVRVYAAVVDEQSFAGAARQLQLPASNVSRHVAALERSLGVRLLERSTRHLRMTEAGRLRTSAPSPCWTRWPPPPRNWAPASRHYAGRCACACPAKPRCCWARSSRNSAPAIPASNCNATPAWRGTGRWRAGITRAAHVHARSPLLLGPIIAEFCASHPGVELQCDTRMAGEQALREDMDLAIVFHRGDQDDSTLAARTGQPAQPGRGRAG